jgi:hypothetical protein
MRFRDRVLTLCVALLLSSPLPQSARAAGAPALTSQDGRVQLQLPDGWHVQAVDQKYVRRLGSNDHYFVALISNNKEDYTGLKAYSQIAVDGIVHKVKDAKASEGRPVKLGEFPALRYEITGTTDKGVRLGYVLTVVETKGYFNQVLSWTMKSQFATYKLKMGELANGVHERAAAPAS